MPESHQSLLLTPKQNRAPVPTYHSYILPHLSAGHFIPLIGQVRKLDIISDSFFPLTQDI